MQSNTEEFMAELEVYDIHEPQLRSFELYEEYSHRNIGRIIRVRRESFDKIDLRAKRELQTEVERDVINFRAWLEKARSLEPTTAHYYSISLKSLLLGLPMGVQIARLFGRILDTPARK